MNPAQRLLQEVCGALNPDDWRADDEGHHFITLDNDVVVTLSASLDGNEWLLTSSPGSLGSDENGEASFTPKIAELDDPELLGAVDRVVCDATSLLVLQRRIPRAMLDAAQLRSELHRCLQMYRWWQGVTCT
jgi:hypothetical protein